MKELSRLRMKFPENCIGNFFKSVGKWIFEKAGNQQHELIVGGSGEARTPDHLIKSPLPHSNISDLGQKPVRTFADIRVFADKLQTK